MDLSAGVPGIALFLAYAGALLPAPRFTALARRALNTMNREIALLRAEMPAIGGFEGWGGLLYTLTHLGVLWEDASLLAQAEEIVTDIAVWVSEDDALDIVRGAAGALGSLLAYYHCTASPQALEVAVACGDHLLAAARPMPQGLGWIAPRFGPQPLAGFAHGAAGIGWALLELAAVTGEGRYRAAAEQAIAYERSLYVPAAANWPDLRTGSDEAGSDETVPADTSPRFMVAWCHGAAGIGLARLAARRHLDDPQLHHELQVALQTTLAAGFGQSHSLCHGDLGNLDLLLEASRTLGDAYWREQVARMAAVILDDMADAGRRSGGPPGVELPGLMLGVAGMGYELLRLAAPEQAPSLLLLQPPVLAEHGAPHLHRQQEDRAPQRSQ
jgi:type 2 lantibiotic biosynthesis protein LanM